MGENVIEDIEVDMDERALRIERAGSEVGESRGGLADDEDAALRARTVRWPIGALVEVKESRGQPAVVHLVEFSGRTVVDEKTSGFIDRNAFDPFGGWNTNFATEKKFDLLGRRLPVEEERLQAEAWPDMLADANHERDGAPNSVRGGGFAICKTEATGATERFDRQEGAASMMQFRKVALDVAEGDWVRWSGNGDRFGVGFRVTKSAEDGVWAGCDSLGEGEIFPAVFLWFGEEQVERHG